MRRLNTASDRGSGGPGEGGCDTHDERLPSGSWLAAFRLLWAGQTVSGLGSEITRLALPLAAVLVLHVSTFEVGVLSAASYVPLLILGVPAGVWIDRVRRRSVMVAADALRALAVGSIPVAAALGRLGYVQLVVVAVLLGTGSLFFDVAYESYLPGLVGRAHLADSNSRLQVSASVVRVAGPSSAGLLVGAVGAPFAFVADACSFVVSVASILGIRRAELAPRRRPAVSLWSEARAGLGFLRGQPMLQAIAATSASTNVFLAAFVALGTVFLVRQVHLPPAIIGLLSTCSAVGAVLGALGAGWLRRRLGSVRIMVVGLACTMPLALLIPLTFPGAGLVLYAVGVFAIGLGSVLYNVHQQTFRQIVCPEELLGRVNASFRVLTWGLVPLGAVLGGLAGTLIGNRNAVWIATAGIAAAPLWLLASPLRRLRDIPDGPAGTLGEASLG